MYACVCVHIYAISSQSAARLSPAALEYTFTYIYRSAENSPAPYTPALSRQSQNTKPQRDCSPVCAFVYVCVCACVLCACTTCIYLHCTYKITTIHYSTTYKFNFMCNVPWLPSSLSLSLSSLVTSAQQRTQKNTYRIAAHRRKSSHIGMGHADTYSTRLDPVFVHPQLPMSSSLRPDQTASPAMPQIGLEHTCFPIGFFLRLRE